MFEGIVATVLNRYLGKYVQDLDTEKLNVGIFSGSVQLHDLRLKPEALYELDLPIEVKVGTIGRLELNIPWGGLYNQSVVINIEDVYVIAGPVIQGAFNADREKRLMRAAKKRKLEVLEANKWITTGPGENSCFLENLLTTVMNNLQVFIRNVHIRYEDPLLNPKTCLACGLCIQGISVEFTNKLWKPCTSSPGAPSVYQLIRLEAFSLYWNPKGGSVLGDSDPDEIPLHIWRNQMAQGLQSFSVNGDALNFIVKPVSAKVKVIVNRSNEARVPKLLVDFVIEDLPAQLSLKQYESMKAHNESLTRMTISRKFRQYRPPTGIQGNSAAWWKYAYNAVVDQRVRPYTWAHVKKHREVYKKYRDVYRRTLLSPNDTELKLDLQKLEDQLDIAGIVIAREDAKLQDPETMTVAEKSLDWWSMLVWPSKKSKAPENSPETNSPSSPMLELQVKTERTRGLWTQLSTQERSKLFEAIGYAEGVARPEKPKQYIEHKMNMTLVNCSLSLFDEEKEVVVLTLTHFLASLETRPSAHAYKASLRIGSAVIEASNQERDLVPIFTANMPSSSNYTNFFAIDFEKNPNKSDADFELTIVTEPSEIVYHQLATSEVLRFFEFDPKHLWECSASSLITAAQKSATLARSVLMSINVDVKAPYIVVPELGCMQKGGSVLVLDLGHATIRSELQPIKASLEDATQMELEERMYDRLHVDISETQVLFCDCGEEWLEARKLQDSDLHLLPKLRCQLVFSESIHQEYRDLARHKLTVSLSSLKLNLSDRRIGLAINFLQNLPLPILKVGNQEEAPIPLETDTISPEMNYDELKQLRRFVVRAALRRLKAPSVENNKVSAGMANLEVEKNVMASDQSDDESELWARTVDQPGFDDNVSPHNNIRTLLRFVIGELVVNLARSSNRIDKPYLLFRIGKICFDSALMEYGPAIQLSVGTIQMVDRLHPGSCGQYLEMISASGGAVEEFFTVLYRKVRSNCPDFKSHFHSVEQSLIVDFAEINFVFHQEAFTTLQKYLQYIINKIQGQETVLSRFSFAPIVAKASQLFSTANDPPIPQGATKFSYSTRLTELRFKMCDTDFDFLEVKIAGVESDCLFKANERMILKFYLTNFSCDDLSGVTLYPKIISIDDDKVIDIKYVRHSPKLYKPSEIESMSDDVKSDGTIKVRLGRVRIVLLYKLIVDLQHFLEPLVRPAVVMQLVNCAYHRGRRGLVHLPSWATRLHISLDLHAPSLLLPQKPASSNLVVFNLGDLSVENFFKEMTAPLCSPNAPSNENDSTVHPVVDNILVKLENLLMSRAVMTLAGSLQVQEPILEPVSIRLDIKRPVAFRGPMHRDQLLYQINGGLDMVHINLGQRDFATLLAVWMDNLADGRFMDFSTELHPASPLDASHSSNPAEDSSVRKLQAFLCQSEHVRKEASVRFTMDGLQLVLFSDMDEILSSPIRDMSHGLCRLELGEATLSLDTFSDHSMELKTSLLCCQLQDIRPDHPPNLKKIFQSHGGLTRTDSSSICVSTPPIVDLTFKQSQGGDRCIDILVEQTRLNLSVGFLASLARFTFDAMPGDRYADGGFVNQGYVGDLNVHQKGTSDGIKPCQRPPSSADSTSGYFSSRTSCAEEQAGLSVSIQLRKPEILLVPEPLTSPSTGGERISAPDSALLFRTELLFDYSKHPGRENLVCSLAGLEILAQSPGGRKRAPQVVLFPCDIELAKSFKSVEEGTKVTGTVSSVDIRLSASTVHTILDVVEDMNAALQADEVDPFMFAGPIGSDAEDLWSPKKMQPYIFPDPCDTTQYNHDFAEGRIPETLTVNIPKLRLVMELERPSGLVPVLLVRAAADFNVHDWSSQMHLKGKFQVQASYYNMECNTMSSNEVGTWEPLIEPIVEEENVYRPWEIIFKVFQAKSFPISSRLDNAANENDSSSRSNRRKKSSLSHRHADDSQTSGDETEPEHCMTFIRRPRSDAGHDGGRASHEMSSLSGYHDDTDSDNEEGVMAKLASAIGHLFTGDSSDGEASQSDDSSGAEPSMETEEASEMETVGSIGGSTVVGNQERTVFLKKHSVSVDSGLEQEPNERYATYILIDARDRLEITVTPAAMRVLSDLAVAFCRAETNCIAPTAPNPPLTLRNTLGPSSTVTLLRQPEVKTDGQQVLLTATYDHVESPASSPTSTTAESNLADIVSPTKSDINIDSFEGGFSILNSSSQSGQEIFSPMMKFPVDNINTIYNKVTSYRINIEMKGFDPMQILCPQRNCNKLHQLSPAQNNTRYYALLNVETSYSNRCITVRSPLQIRNETSYAMGLYYKKSVLETLSIDLIGESTNPFEDTYRVAIIEPDETFDVPLHVAYHCKLHFLPAYVDSYQVTDGGLWWQEIAADLNSPKDIFCSAKEEKDPTVFSLRVLCVEGAPVNRVSRSIPNYLIRLLPPLAVHNRLPYAVEIKVASIKYEVRIEAGEKASIYFLNLLKSHKITVEVPMYLGLFWTGTFNLTPDLEEKTIAMVTDQDTEGGNKQLGLTVRVDNVTTCDLFLHAPFWIINKTGLPLQIRGSLSDVVYKAHCEDPLLFCYRKHRRRCVRLRAYDSSWSSAFSLDTVGAAGLIVCRDRERKRYYRILMTVTLSQVCPHLTKIITLLPNFMVTNESKRHLRFMEENERADLWIDLAPQQCMPFWPVTDSMRMYVKYRDSKVVSQHFPIIENHRTVLRMDRGGGLCVEVSGGGSEQPFSIVFRGYTVGDAPVRVDNLCEDLFLKIHQQNLGQVALLSPYQSMLYTWDDPSKERCLLWNVVNVYDKKCKGFVADFWKDCYGEERVCFHSVRQSPANTTSASSTPTVTSKLSAGLKLLSPKSPIQDGSSSSDDTESDDLLQRPPMMKRTRRDKVVVFWVSFLEAHQRVLLFTQDERIAYQARRRIHMERSHTEMFLSLSGLGVSLTMDNEKQAREIAYLSLTDSAALWEVSVAHRWKPLSLELASWIEDKWRQDHKKAQMKDYVHVDFEKMHMTKPFYGDLRRRYSPAVWVQHRRSEHHSYLRFKLHRIQVDNQLHDAHFPTVLYPAPSPPHVVRRVGVKPCFELVVLKRRRPVYNQDVYKFIKCLMQEFCVQLDRRFLEAVCEAWGVRSTVSRRNAHEKPSIQIRTDLALVHQPLSSIALKGASTEGSVRSVVEYLHLSPMRLCVSFCPRGLAETNHVNLSLSHDRHLGCCDMLDFVVSSLAPSLTEVKNVRLRMAYMERKGCLRTIPEIFGDAVRHYMSQLIQQVHVLVLGNDVLGNPYSLTSDFTDGFGEFFYEPYLGTIESPDEYADGLASGALAILGHLSGGGISSASALFSSSIGNILPSLSFEDEYKKKRRFILHSESDLPETALVANRTFAVGVLLGLSGVVHRPSLGAPQEGAESFFRGPGKGLMGLMTKPSGGVVDCISMARDGLRRSAEMGEHVVLRARLPRFLNPYLGVRPFSVYQATGLHLLNTLSRGHYADSDIYWAHAALSCEGKSTLLISLQHVFLVEKCRQWGAWDLEWVVRVDDIMAVPTINGNKLIFKVRQEESYSVFSGDERSVTSEDPSVLAWLREKVETVLVLNMEDKPAPAPTAIKYC